MTDEVGVITGDLTLRTELHADGWVKLYVQYREADEWYFLSEGLCELGTVDFLTAQRFHRAALEHLARGGGSSGLDLCNRVS